MPVGFLAGLGAALARPEVITGMFGLGASAINHFSQRALSNNAFRQNVAMWQAQNQYNSPSAQVGRLIAAGLNPALAYGGSSQVVGNSETPPQLDYSGVAHQPLISPDAVMQAQQAMIMASQRQALQRESELKGAQTIAELNKAKLSGAEARFADDFAKEKLLSMRLMNNKTYLDCEQVDQTINNLIATRNLTAQQIRQLELANELNDRIMESVVESYQLSNRESMARTRELNMRLKKYSAEIGVLGQQAKRLVTENSFLPRQLTQDLGKGIAQIEGMYKTNEKIDRELAKLSVETQIDQKELKHWFYKNIVQPESIATAQVIGGMLPKAIIH